MATSNISKLCGFDRKVPDLYVDKFGFDKSDKILKGEEYTSVYSPVKASSATLMPPFMKAVALFTGADKSRKWALGKAVDGSYVCELASLSRPEILSITTWDPETGKMRAVSYDYSSGQTLKYSIDKSKAAPSKVHQTDSTALALCMMQEIGADKEAASLLTECSKEMNGEMLVSTLKISIGKLCDNIYRRIDSGELKVDLGDKGTPDQMNMAEIKNSAVKIRETFQGTFQQVGVGDISEIVEIKPGEYNLGLELTEEQKALVPEIDPDYVPDKLDKTLLELFFRRAHLGRYAVRNIILVGPPGSGKSARGKFIFANLGLPVYEKGCSDGTTEDEFLDYYRPEASEGGGNLMEVLRKIPTEAEMALAPETAYMKFTGEEKPGASAEDVEDAVYTAVKAAMGGGLSYKLQNGPVKEWLMNGGGLLLEEPGSIMNPQVLTVLNDVLNSWDGVVQTNEGTIRRHPNCYLIVTNNPPEEGGYKGLPTAFSNRMRTFYVPHPSKDVMIDRVVAQGFLTDESLIEVLVRCINVVEATIDEEGIRGEAGMRALFDWAQDVSFGVDVIEAMMFDVINRVTTDEKEQSLLLEALHENTEIFDLREGVMS